MPQNPPLSSQEALANVLANSYMQTGLTLSDGHDLHVEALSHLQKAISLRPDFAPAIEGFANASYRHAVTLSMEGKLLEAENILRKALSYGKNIPVASTNLAGFLLKRAQEFHNASVQPFKAESCLREALVLRPGFGQAEVLLELVLKSQTTFPNTGASDLEQLVVAEAGLRQELASNPDSSQLITSLLGNLFNQGALSFNNNNFAEAECAFRKVLALQNFQLAIEGLVRTLCHVALDLYNSIRFDEAETALWEALSLQPENSEASKILDAIAGIISRNIPNIMDPQYLACALELRKALCIEDVVGHPYIRKGGTFDGGYVMVDHGLDNAVAYSLGVGNDVSWDLDMAKLGCQIFLYDHTVDRLPAEHPNFHWSKLGVAGKSTSDETFRTINQLIDHNGHRGRKDLILKVDIESAEWSMFAEMSDETLCQFSQIVGEFHRLARIIDPQYRETMFNALNKINKYFQLVHAHANNFTGMVLISGVPIYYCMELTFVRRTDYEFTQTKRIFPTSLDYPCIPKLADMFLGEFGG